MKLEIESDTARSLLGRREVKGVLVFDGATPSNNVVRKEIAVQLKVPEEFVVNKHIYTAFGKTSAKFLVYVYSSKEELKRFEPGVKKKSEAKPAAEPKVPEKGSAKG